MKKESFTSNDVKLRSKNEYIKFTTCLCTGVVIIPSLNLKQNSYPFSLM